jgi:hypothetical protein
MPISPLLPSLESSSSSSLGSSIACSAAGLEGHASPENMDYPEAIADMHQTLAAPSKYSFPVHVSDLSGMKLLADVVVLYE